MLEKKIETLLQPFLDDENAYLVAMEIKQDSGMKRVEIYVDTAEGVLLDQCARISRRLGHIMEEQDVVGSAYRLEVSSPGLSRPLTHPNQFRRNVGKELDVTYINEQEAVVKDTFVLASYEDDVFTLTKGKETLSLKKDHIKEIKIHLKW